MIRRLRRFQSPLIGRLRTWLKVMNVTRRLFTILFVASAASSQLAPAQVNESWKRPFPPFHIVGNLYYVGTEDLACYLITTRQGNILINTGLADSVPLIRSSVEKLGFKLTDIKILLTMQAHYDHVAGMAEIQKATGAKMYATSGDKAALESGGKIDGFGDSPAFQFVPVRVDRTLKDGDTVRLGDTELKVLSHPGHTKGSVSYSFTADENGTKTPVLIVNLLSVVQPLVNNKTYPNIAEDYARSFAAQKQLHPGIWLAGHAGQFDMQAKVKAGSFDDPKGYADAVSGLEKAYEEQLAKQRAGQ
jgi:metallo-beta-lactamase class B